MQPQALKIIAAGLAFTASIMGAFTAYVIYLKRAVRMPSDAGLCIYGADADARFKKVDGRTNGVYLLLTAGFGLLAYAVLSLVEHWRTTMLPPALMTFPMPTEFFGLTAGFFGAGMAAVASGAVMRRGWAEDANWYAVYLSKRRYGCDYDHLCRGIGIALMVLALGAFLAGLNGYVQAREDAFAIHPFFALHEKTFRYSDIQRIEAARKFIAPNGRIRYGRDFVVRFKNGERWVASSLPSGNIPERIQVAQFLSSRSRVPIKEVPIFYTSDIHD